MLLLRALLLAALLTAAFATRAEPAWVILVRHAEKAAEPKGDPGLSEAGQLRARQLAEALRQVGVRHVLISRWRRTRETAAPLAESLGLSPEVVEASAGRSFAQALRERLDGLEGVVLVVGHSNTLAPLLAELGGPRLPDWCETSFAPLLLYRPGASPDLLRLRYGAPDPAPASACL